MKPSRAGLAVVIAVCCAAPPALAQAQPYPAKSVRMVIPYPAGGGTDLLGRPMARLLTEKWGQSVIVDNRGGASGMLGAEIVARSPADGYTILMSASGEVSLNVALYPKMPYDPLRDFVPVTQIAVSPLVLTLHPSLPAANLKEFIALAKKRPEEIVYSSVGAGSPQHMAGEWLNLLAGIRITHVAYKGGGPQLNDLLGGHTHSAFFALPVASPYLKTARMRPIGMTSSKRSSAFPEVPTFAESGLPGFDVTQWWSVLVPRGTPADVVARLHADFAALTLVPEVRERMANLGADPVGGTPEQLGSLIRSEITKYQKIVRDAGIKLE